MKRILITGGAGYIGSHCVKKLQMEGIDTVVLDNLTTGHREANNSCELIVGDVGNRKVLDYIFSNKKIDAVFHLAACSSVAESVKKPSLYYNENVKKLIILLEAMKDNGVFNIIFSSSAAVFGEPIELPIMEYHPKQPINPYGKTKLTGEFILEDYYKAYGIRYCILRYFNAAGASEDAMIGESHDPETHLIPLILQTALKKQNKISIFGQNYPTKDGTCIRDYVHVIDLADAHYKALSYLVDGGHPDAFNLGTNNGFSVLEVVQKVEDITGKPLHYEIAPSRKGDPAKLVASNRKAKEILSWSPFSSTLDQIILDAWRWEINRRY